MNTTYYIVRLNWSGDVSYGVDEGSYIAGIFTCREDAEAFIDSPAFEEKRKQVYEENSRFNGGSVEDDIVRFDSSEKEPLCFGGAGYLE